MREGKAPVVVTHVWYRVGAIDEESGQSGLAHMLEHMMFQGTATVPPGEFSRLIARNGGDDNASTSHDFTNYHINLGADRLDLAMGLEADRMRKLVLADEEFQSENLVVREERRSRVEAKPDARMLERYRAVAHGRHPYGRPVIGWMDDIERHSVAALEAFYRRHYAPNNAVLVVVGDLDLDGATALVEKHFGPLTSPGAIQRRAPPAADPITTPLHFQVSDPEAKLPFWQVGYRVPTLADAAAGEDPLVLDVLSSLLTGGLSSRLHKRLVVTDRLAVAVDADYAALARHDTLFGIAVTHAADVQPRRVERAVLEELDRLAREPVGERELQKVKNGLVAGAVFERDSVDSLAWTIGRAVTSGVPWRSVLVEYPARVRAVSAGDVQRVAAKYFQPKARVVGLLATADDQGTGAAAGGEAKP